MVNGQTADQMLSLLEHIQLGYGAVILSFLGAVHWVRIHLGRQVTTTCG